MAKMSLSLSLQIIKIIKNQKAYKKQQPRLRLNLKSEPWQFDECCSKSIVKLNASCNAQVICTPYILHDFRFYQYHFGTFQ